MLQDEECLRPGDATDLTFLERLEDKMGNHPHFVTWVNLTIYKKFTSENIFKKHIFFRDTNSKQFGIGIHFITIPSTFDNQAAVLIKWNCESITALLTVWLVSEPTESQWRQRIRIHLSLYQLCLSPPLCRHKLADKMTRKTLERGDFRLLHYAGEVTYCVVGKRNHNLRPSNI